MLIFDIAPTELLVLGAVALLVIPPKDLPRAMRVAGKWVGRARGMARQFRSGFDDMIRESEFQEMEKKWREENERIMREFPATTDQLSLTAPAPTEPAVIVGADARANPAPKRKAPAKRRGKTAAKPVAADPATKTTTRKKAAPKAIKP